MTERRPKRSIVTEDDQRPNNEDDVSRRCSPFQPRGNCQAKDWHWLCVEPSVECSRVLERAEISVG